MWRLLASLIAHQAPTPEKQAEREVKDLRMDLFQAEQQVMHAQIRVDYYRARLAFIEDVARNGIEQVSDQRKGRPEERENAVRSAFKLQPAQSTSFERIIGVGQKG